MHAKNPRRSRAIPLCMSSYVTVRELRQVRAVLFEDAHGEKHNCLFAIECLDRSVFIS